ncbi:MAG: FAD-dependent oxidoreductase, partial [Tetragenococcus halophilus]|nr:FAD-dependent oxidoreductase [Tetragenococcus halophilus]
MGKKVVIVGGVAGGASVAARVRRLDEFAEIVMFEKGPYVSFSNCCLPFHISGEVEESEDLVLMNPDQFEKQYNIDARVHNKVVSIDREAKTVLVKNLETGETYEESYDALFLSPGAKALRPKSIPGIMAPHVFVMKTVPDVSNLMSYVEDNNVKDAVVVGGGF